MKGNAIVSAGVVVDKGKGGAGRQILFVKRPDGTVGIPAGRLLGNETPRECAVREFREETGYAVTLDGIQRIITIAGGKDNPPDIGFIFCGQIGPRVGEAEHEVVWIDSTEFLRLLEEEKIFRLQFHIPAFWDTIESYQLGSLDLIFGTVVPRDLPPAE